MFLFLMVMMIESSNEKCNYCKCIITLL
jgi:hypothetical protein